MKAANLLVKCLEKHGVRYVFGIPGAKVDAVFDALVDSPIRVILCRHEQNAAFQAGIYGRLTGKPGVVLVTSGPGVSNLATGLLTATTEGDPIIALGGSVPLAMKYKQSHQSADNVLLLKATTKASLELVTTESIPEIFGNAFRIATQPRSGSVFISLPQDIMMSEIQITIPEIVKPISFGATSLGKIQEAAKIINSAKKPVFLLAQEASRPENTSAIRAFLKKHPFPCVSTYQGAGVISRKLFDCFAGRVGLFQNQPGDILLADADAVVTIGFNSVEYDPEVWNIKQDKKIIHIDYNPADLHDTYMPTVELLGNIEDNINRLSKHVNETSALVDFSLLKKAHQKIKSIVDDAATMSGEKVHPLRFIHDLRESIDDETIVISDIGTVYMWLARYLFAYEPHHLLFSNGQQTLGVALPWAMSARLVFPHKKIISISGDGGFLFSAMELETAVREKLAFVHFVWRDGELNMVAEQQQMKYHRTTAVKFNDIDIVKFAESFGAIGYQLSNVDNFNTVLNQALSETLPVIIDVPIDYSDNAKLFEITRDNIIQ